jgi:two-component system NtrC family sensor kinase
MFNKIGFKLITAVGIASIIIISIFAYMNIQSQTQVLLDEVENRINQLNETVKSSTRFGMMLNHREHVHQIINSIGKQPCIQSVRVFNKEGTIIYSSELEQINQKVDISGEACYSCHASDRPLERLQTKERSRIFEGPDGRIMGNINPIYNEPSCYESECHAHAPSQTVLGVLDVTVCLESIDESIAKSKLKMFIFALSAIVAISLVLWFFVRIWVDKPVKELVEATNNVAAGNLNFTIPPIGKDELGLLARSFNNMTKKLAEARMQIFQSDKMASLGKLAAGVAHEINNPLTGILTYSSFLLKRTKDQPEFQEDLSIIVRETKRSREIVKGLLDFARQTVPKKNNAQINSIIKQAVEVINNQLSIHQIKLEQNLEKDLPEIKLDSNQMQQVIINLFVNSIHAIEKDNGKIIVTSNLISLTPYGITQIKNAICPKGHNLIDETVKIDGMPSIKIQAKIDGKFGYINIDPIYGKNRNHYGIQIKSQAHVDISCPTCNASLLEENKRCPSCNGPIYFFEIPGKGIFNGCAVKGCDWQNWEEIETEGPRKYVEVKIADNGCGIPKENMSKIFDPFFTTKGQKGTGLGLAVIWGIIDNHDGQISVDSTEGEGTTFTIRLPVVKT